MNELLVVRCGRTALQHTIERGECQVMPLVTMTQFFSFHSDGPGHIVGKKARADNKNRNTEIELQKRVDCTNNTTDQFQACLLTNS